MCTERCAILVHHTYHLTFNERLTLGDNIFKHFSSLLTAGPSKLDRLSVINIQIRVLRLRERAGEPLCLSGRVGENTGKNKKSSFVHTPALVF